MLSTADSVEGQGVGSAYKELLKLLDDCPEFEVKVNKGNKCDIRHVHTVNPTYFLKMNRKGVNVAYVHFLPDTLDGSLKLPKPIFAIFKWYVRKFYRKADEIVVVNPIFIKPLVEMGIKEENITYIPNFVDHNDFKKDEGLRKATREKYGLKQDAFLVLGVGQVQHRKGVLDFIEVAKKNPDVSFVWAGGFSFGRITDGYKELEKVYSNPPSNVKFIGIIKREEMNAVYNMADVLFMASYNELFPMAILEAVNLSRPVLLRDLELYEDILFGNYLKASDNDGFSAQIARLREDPSFYEEAAQKSAGIANYYSREHVQALWKEYYPRVYAKYPKKRRKS